MHIGKVVPAAKQSGQPGRRRVKFGQGNPHGRQHGQGCAECPEILGRGAVDDDARAQPLQIIDLVQSPAQIFPDLIAFMQISHQLLHGKDRAKFLEGLVQTGFQQTPAHGGLGLVQDVPQRAASLAPIHGLEQFQVAFRDLVEEQGGGKIQGGEGGQMGQIAFLGQLQIGQKRSAAAGQGRLVVQIKRLQGGHGLGAQDLVLGAASVEIGFLRIAGKFGLPLLKPLGQRLGFGQEQLARVHLDQPLPEHGFVFGLDAGPGARGKIHPGQPAALIRVPIQGAQKVVPLGAQIDVLDHRARSQNPRHRPPHQSLGLLGVLDLIAQRHLVALVEELAQVLVDCVVGHAAHGHGVFRAGVAAGQGNLQFTGGDFGVLEKKLEKIAHAEKDQGVRVLALDPQILLHHGRDLDRAHVVSSLRSWRMVMECQDMHLGQQKKI